jgi:hypothetical protein
LSLIALSEFSADLGEAPDNGWFMGLPPLEIAVVFNLPRASEKNKHAEKEMLKKYRGRPGWHRGRPLESQDAKVVIKSCSH